MSAPMKPLRPQRSRYRPCHRHRRSSRGADLRERAFAEAIIAGIDMESFADAAIAAGIRNWSPAMAKMRWRPLPRACPIGCDAANSRSARGTSFLRLDARAHDSAWPRTCARESRSRRFPKPMTDATALPLVVAMRQKILQACARGDIEALRIPIDWNELRPLFERGARRAGEDPVARLKAMSADPAGQEIIALLRAVLRQAFVRSCAVRRRSMFGPPSRCARRPIRRRPSARSC